MYSKSHNDFKKCNLILCNIFHLTETFRTELNIFVTFILVRMYKGYKKEIITQVLLFCHKLCLQT